MIAYCLHCKELIGCTGNVATNLKIKDFNDYHRLCNREGGKTMNVQKYNKAYVPVVVGVVLFALSHVGVTSEMTLEELLTYVVASAGVYLIPNKK